MNALAKTGTVEAPDILESADGSVLDDIRRPGCAVAMMAGTAALCGSP